MWILLDSIHTERQCKAKLTLMSDVAFMGGLLVENVAVCNGVFTIALCVQHLQVTDTETEGMCKQALRSHLLAISLSHSQLQSFSLSLNGP